MRIFEEARSKAFLGEGAFIAGDAGKEPHAGIEHRYGGDLAAREHVVPDRDLLEAAPLDDAFVDSLEPAAHQDDAGAFVPDGTYTVAAAFADEFGNTGATQGVSVMQVIISVVPPPK